MIHQNEQELEVAHDRSDVSLAQAVGANRVAIGEHLNEIARPEQHSPTPPAKSVRSGLSLAQATETNQGERPHSFQRVNTGVKLEVINFTDGGDNDDIIHNILEDSSNDLHLHNMDEDEELIFEILNGTGFPRPIVMVGTILLKRENDCVSGNEPFNDCVSEMIF